MGLSCRASYLSLPETHGMESPAMKSGEPSVAGRTLRFYWPAPQEAMAKGETQGG